VFNEKIYFLRDINKKPSEYLYVKITDEKNRRINLN